MTALSQADRHPPARSAAQALEVDRVTVRYGGVVAVSEVTLNVPGGETCGIIGPNGAGKTTLFDCISGLRAPSAGRIRLAGEDVTKHSAVSRARAGMRRTFQRPQVFGRLTVLDNVLVALEWRGGGGGIAADLLALPTRRSRERARRDRAREVHRLCGLEELQDTYAGVLPIGLTRLVELARAVADTPHVLLLDEPTSGLGEAEAGRLSEVVAQIIQAHQTAVLLVEHDVGFVMRTCGRVVVLNLGKVLAVGKPAEIRANPDVRAAYLRGE